MCFIKIKKLLGFELTAEEYCELGNKGSNYESALKNVNKAIELKPDFALAYFIRGGIKTGKMLTTDSYTEEHLRLRESIYQDILKASKLGLPEAIEFLKQQ